MIGLGPANCGYNSSGKTSVKEMIASIHAQGAKVHATKGNLNNHIGVPLTLLSMDGDTDIAVIEMIAALVKLPIFAILPSLISH